MPHQNFTLQLKFGRIGRSARNWHFWTAPFSQWPLWAVTARLSPFHASDALSTCLRSNRAWNGAPSVTVVKPSLVVFERVYASEFHFH